MTKNQQVEEKKNVLDKAAIKEPYAPGAAFGLKRKLSRLKDCKRVNISLDIDPFAIFQPRGFGSAQMLLPVRKVSYLTMIRKILRLQIGLISFIPLKLEFPNLSITVKKIGCSPRISWMHQKRE